MPSRALAAASVVRLEPAGAVVMMTRPGTG
jgi:hypothetical protein